MHADPEAIEAMASFSRGSRGARPAFLVFKATPDRGVVIEVVGEPKSTITELIDYLPGNEARWVCFSAQYATLSGGLRAKGLFLSWIPGQSTAKDKMTYSFFAGRFRRAICAPALKMTAHSLDDLGEQEILEAASRFETSQVDKDTGLLNYC